MSAFSTSETLAAFAASTSTARLTTAITSSHSPSTFVNIEFVSHGNPLSRTTRTASATAAPTLSDSPPAGATLNATNTPAPLPVCHCAKGTLPVPTGNFKRHEPPCLAVRSDRPSSGALGGPGRSLDDDGRGDQHHESPAGAPVRGGHRA